MLLTNTDTLSHAFVSTHIHIVYTHTLHTKGTKTVVGLGLVLSNMSRQFQLQFALLTQLDAKANLANDYNNNNYNICLVLLLLLWSHSAYAQYI